MSFFTRTVRGNDTVPTLTFSLPQKTLQRVQFVYEIKQLRMYTNETRRCTIFVVSRILSMNMNFFIVTHTELVRSTQVNCQ